MRFLPFQVAAGIGALGLGIWSFGVAMDVRSVQRGPDGIGMEHVTNQTTLSSLEEENGNYPIRIPWGEAGAKAGEAYENVQVLGNLSTGEFTGLMNNLTFWVAPAIGGDNQHPEGFPQGCNYCHNPANMASDEVYTKHVARRMIQMTRHINGEWGSHVGGTEEAPGAGVNCWTCHRGKNVPEYLWFDNEPDPNMNRMVGGFSAVNKAHPDQGLTSLPMSSFADYLYEDMNIRVVGPTALPTGNTRHIKDTEATYGLMMHMSNALGVNCTYCHNSRSMAEWGQSPKTRTTAWYGIRMVRNLNKEYLVGQGDNALAQYYPEYRLGPTGDVPKVNCLTCHQGAYKPMLGKDMISDYPMLAEDDGYVFVAKSSDPPLKVEVAGDRLDLSDKVYFEVNSAAIKPKSFPLLDLVAQVLNENPGLTKLEIQGHTDNTGDADENLGLSQVRAEEVRRYLVEKGVDPARLAPKGYGQTEPRATNDTDEGRFENRRVEFVIVEKE